MFWNNKDRDKDNQIENKDNDMATQTKNKYYLEVIGGSNANQLYVVNADKMEVKDKMYEFINNPYNGVVVSVAMYPIERTIIKSIEIGDQ